MKTIDVMEGDTWTLVDDGGLFQYRNKQWRGVYADTHESEMYWRADDGRLHCELEIPSAHARGLLIAWGYTLTPAAKPEAKPADVPVGEQIIAGLTNFLDSLKADVPVVDAVWVETSWGDGVKVLYSYPTPEDANEAVGEMRSDEKVSARIVRIRSVDEEARQTIDETRNTVRELDKAAFTFDERLSALESRLAAVESIANCKGIYIPASRNPPPPVSERPQGTPPPPPRPPLEDWEGRPTRDAARVVLPKCEHYHAGQYRSGFCDALAAVRTALASQGITIADEGSSSNG